jgi:hypothetical protein
MNIMFVPAVWTIFTGFLLWYMVGVKRGEPITTDEAKMLWKIHKTNSHCLGKNWQPLVKKGGKLKGFQCECGYKYIQKRPLIAGTHKTLKDDFVFPTETLTT